jgi:uncharacterized protein with GYD domain
MLRVSRLVSESKEKRMATFVTLYQWTEQGVKNYPDSVQRGKDATAAAERMGGKIISLHWTTGRYDLVSIGEFPDDETATAFALKLSSLGNVRTTTMRAFGSDEMAKIIAKAK